MRAPLLFACGWVAGCIGLQDLGVHDGAASDDVDAGPIPQVPDGETSSRDAGEAGAPDASDANATPPSDGAAEASDTSSEFSDPITGQGQSPLVRTVEHREVRLLVRLVENSTSFSDLDLRKWLEWDAWRYMLCYERAFRDAGPPPEGTVRVRFHIFNGKPSKAAVEATTIASSALTECLVNTVAFVNVDDTPSEEGPAVESFRFVLVPSRLP